MRISGTEASSVILSQTKNFKKLKSDAKMPKQAEAIRDGLINPKNYNFDLDFITEFDFLPKITRFP